MSGTLLLSAADVRAVLPMGDCIAAVEAGFRLLAEGGVEQGVLGMHTGGGGFHLKAAAVRVPRPRFVAKLNGNFPDNPARFGLPSIQGVVALCDADNGRLLALIDSAEITRIRTGAATAVAARYLARPDSAVLTVFGCGRQAESQVEALMEVLPIARVWLNDPAPGAADRLADRLRTRHGIESGGVEGVELSGALARSDVIVTCTPSRRFFLTRAMVPRGAFVAGVGTDDSRKQELEPELLAENTVVADVLEQCLAIGDLHHAHSTGLMTRQQVHAELAEVVAGAKLGRTDRNEITVFDSTGTAVEDVAAAALCYERASAEGRGFTMHFDGGTS
ncbi:MAG TPA: ornithine cyclodeaminase family protein [Gemmatimonadales bacterium]|nr:ornithine cyclodeaminase family protein [Gemmatimonadales bacterium]